MAEQIEDFRRFSIHDLKRLGMMCNGFNGSLNWTSNGQIISTIGLYVGLSGSASAVTLHYTLTHTGEKVMDFVSLHFQKSNLPNHAGGYWMFLCPVTGNPCRMLYLHDGHFKSRKALPLGTVYKCQTYTGFSQVISRAFGYEDAVEELTQALLKPYGKEMYRGKPTRMVRRLIKKEYRSQRAVQIFLSTSQNRK